MDYSKLKYDELTKICKSRKIKYTSILKKHEMSQILTLNDQNPTITTLPEVETRIAIKRENQEIWKKERKLERERNPPPKWKDIVNLYHEHKNEDNIDEIMRKGMKKLSMNKLEELSPKDETMDYSNLSYDELFQMFKERKIKYYGKSIEKQELIHLITEFDKDLPIFDYPKMNCKQLKQICRERKIFYPDNVKKQDIIQLIIQNHEDTLKIKQQIKKR